MSMVRVLALATLAAAVSGLGINVHASGGKMRAAGVSMMAASKLTVTGKNVEVTDPLRNYAETKLNKNMMRYERMLTSVTVHLKVEHRGGGLHDIAHQGLEAHVAEVTALCRDKQVIRVCSDSDNMYASLDELSDRLGRQLRKYKERRSQRKADQKGGNDVFDEMFDFDVPEEAEEEGYEAEAAEQAPALMVRKKSFPMPPTSVAEAALCLDYIDHDFYVFRNTESGQVNVVYKRKGGGVGLIEPEA
jgi:putative sigma-54 modulation protein